MTNKSTTTTKTTFPILGEITALSQNLSLPNIASIYLAGFIGRSINLGLILLFYTKILCILSSMGSVPSYSV